jgi:hypothetical protein
MKDKNFLEDTFGAGLRGGYLLNSAKGVEGGGGGGVGYNILNLDAMEDMWDNHEEVLGFSTGDRCFMLCVICCICFMLYMFYVVCCMLYVICCMLYVICYMLYVVCCLPVCCMLYDCYPTALPSYYNPFHVALITVTITTTITTIITTTITLSLLFSPLFFIHFRYTPTHPHT